MNNETHFYKHSAWVFDNR